METLRVGRTIMRNKTVPVEMIFEETSRASDSPPDVIADRFRVLEIDGYYLVIQKTIFRNAEATEDYKSFMSEADAFDYLKELGVERE